LSLLAAHAKNFVRKSWRAERLPAGRQVEICVMWWGPDPSGWGVVHSKFSEVSLIFSKFYRHAAVFYAAFLPPKKRQTNLTFLKGTS